MDINAACSGFIYALEKQRGASKRICTLTAFIIGVEQLSRLLDMTDRSTCVLLAMAWRCRR